MPQHHLFSLPLNLANMRKRWASNTPRHPHVHTSVWSLPEECSEACLHWAVFSQRLLKWRWFLLWPTFSYQDPGTKTPSQCPKSCGSAGKRGTRFQCSWASDCHYDRPPLAVVCQHTKFKRNVKKRMLCITSFCIFQQKSSILAFCVSDTFLTRPLILVCFHITNTNQQLCKAQLFWMRVTSKNVSGISTTIC